MSLIDNKAWFELESEHEPNKWQMLKRYELTLEATDALADMREKFPMFKHRLKYVRVIEKILNL